MPLEGWSVPLGPRVGIEPTSEPVPKFRLNQPDRRDRYGGELSEIPHQTMKRKRKYKVFRPGADCQIRTDA